MNGKPMIPLKSSIPPTNPRPNMTMYASPANGEGIVLRTSNINAALPAKPCTMPTKNGRRMALNGWLWA